MTDHLSDWILLVGGVSGALGVIYKIVQVIVKRFPPRAVGLAAEVASLRGDMKTIKSDMRLLTDYVHDLREDYARETGKAPKDWPEGLRL